MSDKSGDFPTVWHRWFSAWVLRSPYPFMSMERVGWPFLYTLASSVLIYGVGMVIFATNRTSNTALALATAVFALVTLVTIYVAMTYVLKLLFMPLNVDRDPLTHLLDFMDAWIAYINGLTSIAMIVFIWDQDEFGLVLPTDPPYRIWLKLLFTATHDFHSAGFGQTQAVGDWGLATFIAISYAGRFVLVLGVAALVRLMSRNLKRHPKRYSVAGAIPDHLQRRDGASGGKQRAREQRLAQVGMDRRARRVVGKRGTLRSPSTVNVMETPNGGYAVQSSLSGRSRK